MQVHHLDAISPGIAEVTAETFNQLDPVLARELLTYSGDLRIIPDHDAKVLIPRDWSHALTLKHGEKLMLSQLKEGIPFTPVLLVETEDILIESDSLLNVSHLDGDMVAAVHLDSHFAHGLSLPKHRIRRGDCVYVLLPQAEALRLRP